MSQSTVSTAVCFIDLATFSEVEGFIYGGPTAQTWFVGAVQKSNWFSFIPILLRNTGTFDFGQTNVSSSINRSGDYVLNVWFTMRVPQIVLNQPYVAGGDPGIFMDSSVRWTKNLMHNIFQRVNITFNELVVEEFQSEWFDFNYQFRLRGSKRIGYRNMIGDVSSMTTPVPPGVPLGDGSIRSCPLPFFFSEDSGIALPVAALPFNDIKVNFYFRPLNELIAIYPGTTAVGGPGGPNTGRVATVNDVYMYGSTNQRPSMQNPSLYAHYAVVHNDERVKMGDAPRDILMTQTQSTNFAPFKDVSSKTHFDVRLSHSIIMFTFAAKNVSLYHLYGGTFGSEQSNYTTEPNYAGLDPILFSQLIYENTVRVSMASDYYSLIAPYYFSDAIPEEAGYHMYTYALHPWLSLKPSGSTNYSKLANVSIEHDMSPAAQAAAGVNGAGVPQDQNGNPIVYPDTAGILSPFPQQWRHVLIAYNWNIVRVANGSLGHPTL
jgi:hypothetical protein